MTAQSHLDPFSNMIYITGNISPYQEILWCAEPSLDKTPQLYHHRPLPLPPINFPWCRAVSHTPSTTTQRKPPLLDLEGL